MMRHHHLVKNRQQSLLNRAAVEMGVDSVDINKIQGKLDPTFSQLWPQFSYDELGAAISKIKVTVEVMPRE